MFNQWYTYVYHHQVKHQLSFQHYVFCCANSAHRLVPNSLRQVAKRCTVPALKHSFSAREPSSEGSWSPCFAVSHRLMWINYCLSESHSPWKTAIPEIYRNVNVAWSISRSISIENDSSVSMSFFWSPTSRLDIQFVFTWQQDGWHTARNIPPDRLWVS